MSECIAKENQTDRVCFDKIGTPVLQFAIFGNITCVEKRQSNCDSCKVLTPALQTTFLLYNNDYSTQTAE